MLLFSSVLHVATSIISLTCNNSLPSVVNKESPPVVFFLTRQRVRAFFWYQTLHTTTHQTANRYISTSATYAYSKTLKSLIARFYSYVTVGDSELEYVATFRQQYHVSCKEAATQQRGRASALI